MKRIHLFEFEDQPWFPKLFRGFMTDLIQYQQTNSDVYTPLVPKIMEIMQKLDCRQIIDLCSGSGGPLFRIQEILSTQKNYPVSITLTDKYPNVSTFQKLCHSSKYPVNFIPVSVDATSVPNDYQGIRTLFSSFHHFRPNQAKQILQDAVNRNAPIGIFEYTERTRSKCISTIKCGPLIVLRTTPSIQHFKWSRFFWTYIIPVMPLVFTWDALVSYLRSYSIRELNQMVSELKPNNYTWEIGQIRGVRNYLNITYLFGFKEHNIT
jgi:hypothetical protein